MSVPVALWQDLPVRECRHRHRLGLDRVCRE